MIRLEPLGKKQFLLRADEPMRVEVTEVEGHLIAFVYRGTDTDRDQEPLGCFDSSQENMQWQTDVSTGLAHPNLCPACHCLGNPKTYVNGHTTYECINPSCEYEDRWDVKDETFEPTTEVETKWKLPFTEFVVTDEDEKYRLVWEWIGEGDSGDYDSRNPEDTPYLRANLEMWEDGEKEDTLSYCTMAPTDTPKSELLRMAHALFVSLNDDEGRSKRRVMERWTHETRPRKFRRSLVEIEVLSEGDEHLGFDDLSDLHEKITNGACSGQFGITLTEVVDADAMAKLLKEQGSSPEFFDIEEPEE